MSNKMTWKHTMLDTSIENTFCVFILFNKIMLLYKIFLEHLYSLVHGSSAIHDLFDGVTYLEMVFSLRIAHEVLQPNFFYTILLLYLSFILIDCEKILYLSILCK